MGRSPAGSLLFGRMDHDCEPAPSSGQMWKCCSGLPRKVAGSLRPLLAPANLGDGVRILSSEMEQRTPEQEEVRPHVPGCARPRTVTPLRERWEGREVSPAQLGLLPVRELVGPRSWLHRRAGAGAQVLPALKPSSEPGSPQGSWQSQNRVRKCIK